MKVDKINIEEGGDFQEIQLIRKLNEVDISYDHSKELIDDFVLIGEINNITNNQNPEYLNFEENNNKEIVKNSDFNGKVSALSNNFIFELFHYNSRNIIIIIVSFIAIWLAWRVCKKIFRPYISLVLPKTRIVRPVSVNRIDRIVVEDLELVQQELRELERYGEGL